MRMGRSGVRFQEEGGECRFRRGLKVNAGKSMVMVIGGRWKKERSRIIAVQMDNLRGLLGIRRMDKVPNARLRELYGVTNRVDERIDKNVVRWFCHVEIMENDRVAKRVYVGECAGSRSLSRPRKR